MPSKVNFRHPKWPIDQKWPEMQSIVIFGHPKWPPKKKNIYIVQNSLSMAFLAISDQYKTFFCKLFYQMATGAYFGCPKYTFDRISGHLRSIRNFNVFWNSKMATGSHFVKKITKIKIMVLIWNGKKWFLDIQNGYRWPFKKKTFTKKIERMIWTLFEPTAGRIQLDINSLLVNIYTDRYIGNEGIYIVFAL